jgi:hypothetical protein
MKPQSIDLADKLARDETAVADREPVVVDHPARIDESSPHHKIEITHDLFSDQIDDDRQSRKGTGRKP